jgi:hypothetical protein
MYLSDSPGPRPYAHIHLSEGKRGILETANYMRTLVVQSKTDMTIRNLALSLVRFLPDKDEIGEIETVFNYVRDHIRYVKDIYGVETLSTPEHTLEIGQGDCDDKSVLLASLLESIGYSTMFKLTGYHGNEFEHVMTFVVFSNGVLTLDPTEPEPAGYEPPGATVECFVA